MRRKPWNISVNMARNKWESYGDVDVLAGCTKDRRADGVIGTRRSEDGWSFDTPWMIFLTMKWLVGS